MGASIGFFAHLELITPNDLQRDGAADIILRVKKLEGLRIRLLRSHAEYRMAEDIEKAAWRFPDREVVPLSELVVAQRIGGATIGAFLDGKMIGFCFGVPAFVRPMRTSAGRPACTGGKVYHYSRMLGVLPRYQNSGVGLRLKLFQKRLMLQRGTDSIKWTYDPLQSRNAYFNLVKLGCTANEYLVNTYGTSRNKYNRGLETDRFVVRWRLMDRRKVAIDKRELGRIPVINRTALDKRGFRKTASISSKWERKMLVEIPGDINALKSADLKLAQEWRFATRAIFQKAFRDGYAVTGCAFIPEGASRRFFYLLQRGGAK